MDKVTAICVSHSSRLGLLQRAVINFAAQDYENKQLVIVSNEAGYQDAVKAFLNDPRLNDALEGRKLNVQLMADNFRNPVEGVLKAMARCGGDYFVAWDDDNLSRPDRLTFQVERTATLKAPTFLMDSLYYFYDSDELFVTNYAQPGGNPSERCAVASAVWHRSTTPNLDLNYKGTWTGALMQRLFNDRAYEFVSADPTLFLVGSNGDNHRGEELHRKLGSGLPATWKREQLEAASQELEEKLQGYRFPSTNVDVCGKDAQAFQINDARTWPAWLAPVLPPDDWRLRIPNRDWQQQMNAERRQRAQAAAEARRKAQADRKKTQPTDASDPAE